MITFYLNFLFDSFRNTEKIFMLVLALTLLVYGGFHLWRWLFIALLPTETAGHLVREGMAKLRGRVSSSDAFEADGRRMVFYRQRDQVLKNIRTGTWKDKKINEGRLPFDITDDFGKIAVKLMRCLFKSKTV